MKRFILLFIILLCVTGCTKLNESTYIDIVNQVLESNIKLHNKNGKGYNYYLPKNVSLYDQNDNNTILKYKNRKMYMYVDLISFYNKTNNEFIENDKSYYSKKINYKDKFGYLEINKYKSGYFVEMMYNYSKIETYVNKEDLNDIVYNISVILSSMNYNQTIISSLVGESNFNYKEEIYNIFKPIELEDNYLKFEEDIYEDYDGEIVDEDKLIIENENEQE